MSVGTVTADVLGDRVVNSDGWYTGCQGSGGWYTG